MNEGCKEKISEEDSVIDGIKMTKVELVGWLIATVRSSHKISHFCPVWIDGSYCKTCDILRYLDGFGPEDVWGLG